MTKLSVKQLLSALPFTRQLISRYFLPVYSHQSDISNLEYWVQSPLVPQIFDPIGYDLYSNEDTLEGDDVSFTFLPKKKGYLLFNRPSLFSKPLIDAPYGYGSERWGNRRLHYSAFPLQKNKDGKGANSKFAYAIVPKEKSEIISHFLMNHYHQQEPITVALGMPISEVEGWFERFIRRSMFASLCDVSVQAIDEKKGKRVGVLSSIVIDPTRSRPELTDFTDEKSHPISAQMNEFYDALEEGLEPAEGAGVMKKGERPPKLLEHLFISVHKDYRHQGISGNMVKLSESLASTINGCRVGYTIATSEFSYAIFLKSGYKVVREMKYSDYKDSKGEKIFAGKEDKMKPHHSCRAMVKVFEDPYK